METGFGLDREYLARRVHYSGALPTKNHRRLRKRSAAGQFAARSVLQRTNSKESDPLAFCRGARGSGRHRRSRVHVGFGVLRRLSVRTTSGKPPTGAAGLFRRSHLRTYRSTTRRIVPSRLVQTRPSTDQNYRFPLRGESKLKIKIAQRNFLWQRNWRLLLRY